MRKIYTLGETVYDIIFSGDKIESSCVGGSVVNTSISIGRLGLPIYLISQFGDDKIGNLINDFLVDNNINTDYIYRYSDAKTPLALAFLNSSKDAKYEFYKEKSAKTLHIEIPDFNENDILLFGSYFSINLELRERVLEILEKAKKANSLIIYDPNFRNPNKPELENLKQNVLENFEFANIIRGSKDDFIKIFGFSDIGKIYTNINNNQKLLIITDGGNSIEFIQNNNKYRLPISILTPFSTIGAGDNFNAGLIFGFNKLNIFREQIINLEDINLKKIVNYGIKFAQNVCMSFENYISLDFAKKIK